VGALIGNINPEEKERESAYAEVKNGANNWCTRKWKETDRGTYIELSTAWMEGQSEDPG